MQQAVVAKQDLRTLGPAGVTAYVARHGAGPSVELDRICAQHEAHTARLYWFTDLPAAIAEARRTRRPILSLRLLGRLDQALSCANSRFFRRMLYPHATLNTALRDRFVLHWQTVRPVPIVTIDFGNGKRVTRPLTGNSLHLVLDPAGRPVDALPGLVSPEVFATQLVQAHRFALADRAQLAAAHGKALAQPVAPPPLPDRATAASMVAMTKHVVEAPILRAIAPPSLAHDTRTNLALHARIHDAFARGRGVQATSAELVAWIYRDLFLMPPEDPALGLDVADPL
jgi:hypothetical protein